MIGLFFRLEKGRGGASYLGCFLVLGALFSTFFAGPAVAQVSVGLWVEAESHNRPFDEADKFKAFLDYISEFGFTDLYCQVYRESRSWFPSKLTDDGPFQRAIEAGFDPLGDTINVAHTQGKKVHAWINTLRADRELTAPGLRALGKHAVLEDNRGHSLLDYNERGEAPGLPINGLHLDTPGAWLDPSSPGVRQYVVRLVRDVLERYPEIDGIHLDMIRYPFISNGRTLSFPYGEESEARFRAETGKVAPRPGGVSGIGQVATQEQWDAWRRDQITRLVFDVRQEMDSIHPGKELTAAVVASPDRAESAALQDWRNWVASGALSAALPMNYTEDRNTFSANARYAVSGGDPSRMRIGIGAWLMVDDPQHAVDEVLAAQRLGAGGVVLYSFSNLYSPRGRELVRQVFLRTKG